VSRASVVACCSLLALAACGGDTLVPSRDAAPDATADVVDDVPVVAADAHEDSSVDDATDAASTPHSPPAEPPLGPPVTPDGLPWQWVPVPESRCMNGTPTGFGVSFSRTGSRRVLIVLEGGGSCFDLTTCTTGTVHQDGFNELTFRTVITTVGASATFNRLNPTNPFADWNHVFIPYCSGDFHSGDNARGALGRMHVGYRNFGYFLSRIATTFRSATAVVLAGSSAGGYGATLEYDRTTRRLAPTPVHLLADSSPTPTTALLKPCLSQQLRDAWNLDATSPADCPECRGPTASLHESMRYLLRAYPSRRFAWVSSQFDTVVRSFLGYGHGAVCSAPGLILPSDFRDELLALRGSLGAGHAGFKSFIAPGDTHTWLLTDVQLATTVETVALSSWIAQFVAGQPTWRDVGR
jgi:hypothetical protein